VSITNASITTITGTSATLNFSYAKGDRTDATTVTFTIVATPVGGGAPITLDSSTFSLPFDDASGTTQVAFDYAALPAGDYNVQVTAALSRGTLVFGSNIASASNVDIPCFLAGTMIATPMGDVAVETLRAGDLVLTADGRAIPVVWLGRRTVFTVLGMPEALQPVRIAAGALGAGQPSRDLRVTTGHALMLDGILVEAGALVNGMTVTRMGLAQFGNQFTVYHIETENHEVILAEGTPVETYIDNSSRALFDNHDEFEALFGTEYRAILDLDCPRAMSRRQVPAAIRARIAAQVPPLSDAA
jgi:hypothetical protein